MKITPAQQATMDALASLIPPQRQAGDIDIYQIAKMFRMSENGSRGRMKSMVNAGLFIDCGLVFDIDRNRRLRVWRAVSPTSDNDNNSET